MAQKKTVWAELPDAEDNIFTVITNEDNLTVCVKSTQLGGEVDYFDNSPWYGDEKVIKTDLKNEFGVKISVSVDRNHQHVVLGENSLSGAYLVPHLSKEFYDFSGEWIIDPRDHFAASCYFLLKIKQNGSIMRWEAFGSAIENGFKKGVLDFNECRYGLEFIIGKWTIKEKEFKAKIFLNEVKRSIDIQMRYKGHPASVPASLVRKVEND